MGSLVATGVLIDHVAHQSGASAAAGFEFKVLAQRGDGAFALADRIIDSALVHRMADTYVHRRVFLHPIFLASTSPSSEAVAAAIGP